VTTDRTYLRDAQGRYLTVHGVNVSGSSKAPPTEVFGSTTDDVSYVGSPFPLDEADRWFGQLRDAGFNTIRLIMMWEAIEPHARGEYDEEYLDYIERIVEIAEDYGIYVLMDMHQDMLSRHIYVLFNRENSYGYAPDSLEGQLLGLLPDEDGEYSDWLRGDGMPRWATQACLQEKNMDSPNWGRARLLGGMTPENLGTFARVYTTLFPDVGDVPEWVGEFVDYSFNNDPFGIDETSDLLPWTTWGINHALSSDAERLYACLLAGEAVYPDLAVDGVNVQEYLQSAYADAFAQVAMRVSDQENVIGYEIMNEPGGTFVMMSVLATFFGTGSTDALLPLVQQLMGEELGQDVWDLIVGFNLLPADAEPETVAAWGYEGVDMLSVLGLNIGFEANHLQPFYERVGQAIQDEDENAIIWFESPLGIEVLFGGGGFGQFEVLMSPLEGINQQVYAPHWYPDIYPMPGFNQQPRQFEADEIRFRDYREKIEEVMWRADYSLGNIPVVYGEFGTYFNFNGIDASIESDYLVSQHVLDNYYEAFEETGLGHIQWCFSPTNSHEIGEGWNSENFSITDPDGELRGEEAFARPHARALAGKPITSHFYSDLHYFDPDKGEVDPLHEFVVRYQSRETDAPSMIFTAEQIQYPNGFYVWLSDGYAYYDAERQLLYHYPTNDSPGAEHSVRLLPPLEGQVQEDWDYFIQGDRVLDGPGRDR